MPVGFMIFPRPSWEPSTSFGLLCCSSWGRSAFLSRPALPSLLARSSLSTSRHRFCLPPAVSPLFLPSLPAMFSGAWRRPLIRPSPRSLPPSLVPSQPLLAYLPRFCFAPFYRYCVTLPRSGERTAVAAAEVTLTMPVLDRNAQAIKQSIRYTRIKSVVAETLRRALRRARRAYVRVSLWTCLNLIAVSSIYA